ncbi:MAG TPA: DHA2 family efflux MFS transporter permease subunit [Beijerinckiaceae bacterium]|nr:DHA2 family efflux MFS transporter permease subunit [Beijerinckiaceae bacterium]
MVAPATWIGFGTMCVGMFMAVLDVQVVATSLPTIQDALTIEPDQMSWIQTAYLVAEVIAIPLTGFLTRVLSMRWLFVSSIAIFTFASAQCANSGNFADLILWRVLQGFSAGTLIPAVFTAVFLLFPVQRQGIATTLAGALAVLAPTLGPVVGGWITDTYSWRWLFLINVVPGIFSTLVGALTLPRSPARLGEIRKLDIASLISMATALAALEIALKKAPQLGWTTGPPLAFLVVYLASGSYFIQRTLRARHPVVDLRHFSDPDFVVGCILSFVLGMGLFGSVYLMPVFLAFVRAHDALEIGEIMLVTGIAQLLVAPFAVALEQRVETRLLTAIGFVMFGIGLGLSGWQTPRTDYAEMFWPQVVRGSAIMFCLLPPTRMALGHLDEGRVPDASGLFNLMRNLGGAIGLALIDTVIYGRAPVIGATILSRLQAGDANTAKFVGIPPDVFAKHLGAPLDPHLQAALHALVDKAARVQAMNEAWDMLALFTFAALIGVPFAKRIRRHQSA